ncbi:MAG: tetratricopeptide repeat protein [Stigonema ocellatum SAG 48.90 = DSM 106950]|nr:tetratricopeptide repeat protein [Stigonema ocellatum SAG 48.90 = DSM 106950]
MREIFDLFLTNSLAKRADRKLQQGDFKGAIQEYNQALSRDPNDAISYGHRGYAFALLGDHKRALPILEDGRSALIPLNGSEP